MRYTNSDIPSKSDPFLSYHPLDKKSNVKYINFYSLEKNNKDIKRFYNYINTLKETLQKEITEYNNIIRRISQLFF